MKRKRAVCKQNLELAQLLNFDPEKKVVVDRNYYLFETISVTFTMSGIGKSDVKLFKA